MAAEEVQVFAVTADGYDETGGATISNPQLADPYVAVELEISGAGVYYKVEERPNVWSSDETFCGPRVGCIALGVAYGIKFRSALAGSPATVSARMLTGTQVQQAGGLSAFSGPTYAIAPDGGVTPVQSGDVIPAGMIFPFAGAVAPAGYVFCDGTEYDGTQSTYAALWAAIGVTYGGSGQSAFAVPDLRGRTVIGKGPNAAVDALGENDGVAAANRRGTTHRHTPHHHTLGPWNTQSSGTGTQALELPTTIDNHAQITPATTSVDGGSGVATDPVDGGAFLVLNYVIKL